MLNSLHAYSQNKAFTKHIVDALMQSYEEKLELEVFIPRKRSKNSESLDLDAKIGKMGLKRSKL